MNLATLGSTLRRRMIPLAALWLGVVALTIAAPAPAQAQSGVLVLPTDGDGAPASECIPFTIDVETQLAPYRSLKLVPGLSGDLLDAMIDLECTDLDLECMVKFGKHYRADYVIHVSVTPQKPGFAARFMIVDVAAGTFKHDHAARYSGNQARMLLIGEELKAAFGTVPSAAAPGVLTVEANDPAALIQVGTDVIGKGRGAVELPAGTYTVRVSSPGRADVIRTVTLGAGEKRVEQVALEALAVEVPPAAPTKKGAEADEGGAWWPWAIVGAVVVGGAVAAIAVAASSGGDGARGPMTLSLDSGSAWRDVGTFGGRP